MPVDQVRHRHETIVISDYGTPAVATIPVDELAEPRRLRDEADSPGAQPARLPVGRW